jgi:hypothetical protein
VASTVQVPGVGGVKQSPDGQATGNRRSLSAIALGRQDKEQQVEKGGVEPTPRRVESGLKKGVERSVGRS